MPPQKIQARAVACYCRVSTESQIENYSIDEQRERLEAFCKAHGWTDPKMYIDPGFSGGSLNRPALNKLIDDVKAQRINTVVVYKLDRLSRSQKDTLYLIEDIFGKNNTDFISVCENFDTSTPLGKAMIGIISVFAQLEKDQITERFTMGRIGRAKNGLFHGGGAAPTGYDYVDGHLVVNEFAAMQVREVFSRFLHGESVHAIQRYMSEHYGGWSSHTLVYAVLKNSVYIGKVKFAGEEYDGEHSPIISAEMFYETQRLLGERSANTQEHQKTPFRAGFLLSGLVYCGNCGAKYHGNHGYYKCYSRAKSDKKYIIDPNCKNPNVTIGELDDYVKNEIYRASVNPSSIEKYQETTDPNIDRRNALTEHLEKIRAQADKLLDLYQIGNIPVDSIGARLQALEAERERIQTQLDSVPKIYINRRQEFDENLARCHEVLENAPLEEQRLYVASIIRRIIVNANGTLEIKWRF